MMAGLPNESHSSILSGFEPRDGIPDLSERVCLITGGSSGLGEATVKALAEHNPKKLYLAARSRARAEAAISRIRASVEDANIEILDLDLASFASIKTAAARVNEEVDRLDLLQLNGGIAMVPPGLTMDGYELQFGTDYLGHALLTQLLMPKMLATAALSGADVRIVSISSTGHKRFVIDGGIQFDKLQTDMKDYGGPGLYSQAMLAKVLFAYELAKRYPTITSSSLNPGLVKSGVWSGDKNVNWFVYNLFVKPIVALAGVSSDEAAKTQLWCSFSKEVESGCYYEPLGKTGGGGASMLARDDKLSKRLWEWTEKELQSHAGSKWVTNS